MESGIGRRRAAVGHLRDPVLPVVFNRQQARLAGLTDRQIDRRMASGAWVAVRRGQLRVALDRVALDRVALDRVALDRVPRDDLPVRAALGSAPGRDLVVSHASAAMLHGLPAPIGGWGPPTLTATSGTARRGDVHVRVAPLSDGDVERVAGLPVTGMARTVIDCLRTLAARDGLAIADAALRRGLLRSLLAEQVARQLGWPGIVQARELLELADGRRESPLESWSALAFHRAGLPRPDWQVDIRTAGRVFCGRVDAWWPEGLAGEADGRAKYALAAAQRAGEAVPGLLDALGRERGRELSIRRTRAEVVRWGATDVLRKPETLCKHLTWHLQNRANSNPFTGIATKPTMRAVATG